MSQIKLGGVPAQKDIRELRKNATLRTLIDMTPAQVENYIDNNVNNLESAKAVLKIYGKILIALAKRVANA